MIQYLYFNVLQISEAKIFFTFNLLAKIIKYILETNLKTREFIPAMLYAFDLKNFEFQNLLSAHKFLLGDLNSQNSGILTVGQNTISNMVSVSKALRNETNWHHQFLTLMMYM